MIKEVVINIRSVIDYGLAEEDRIDFSTDGVYRLEGDVAHIAYLETEVTGLQGTRTSVKVMPDQVIVDRRGTLTSRMEFREGQKNSFLYDTPAGMATMNMNTRSVRHRFDPAGGELEIDYVLDMEHAVISRNKFQLTVREQKQMGV
ncbi:MAG: DUF1934 domain-containing protein [Oscillospiraceae bacterium]|nr:DUF1934 domain-containing protein [Oscillospiraceae bacterium]